MLYITMLVDQIRYRAERLRDEETGAISTVELLVLIALIVGVVTAAIAVLGPRISDRANTVPLS
jgi:hypothetical protein